MARVTLASLVLALSLVPPPASAAPPRSKCSLPPTDLCTDYVWRGRSWGSMPIPYFINLANAPLGADQDIHDAFLAWQNEVGSVQVEAAYPGDQSNLSFLYQGPTTATGGRDGINTVYFGACSQCGPGAATIAVEGGRVKRIVEFDIFLKAGTSWATDLTCPSHTCGLLDLQNVITHESGTRWICTT